MVLVVCTSVDLALAKTRQLLLESVGHTVITVTNESILADTCKQHSFDVVVIGQDIAPEMKRRVLRLVRESCGSARVLELYKASLRKVLDHADSWLEVPVNDPQELADRVTALAAKAARGSI